jgi:hypothetical protein
MQKAIMTNGTAPVPPVFIFEKDMSYKEFLVQNEYEAKESTLYSYAICVSSGIKQRPRLIDATDAIVAMENVFEPEFILETVDTADRWLMELVMAYQTSGLVDRNIESLFQSYGTDKVPTRCLALTRFLSSRMDRLLDLEGAQDLVAASPWMEYRTAVTACSALIQKAIDSAPAPGLFTESDMVFINAAAADVTNIHLARAIPNRVLVLTSAILTTCGGLPDTWYMGKSAVDLFPPSKYNALCVFLKRGHAIANDTGGIDDINEISVIVDKVGDLMST